MIVIIRLFKVRKERRNSPDGQIIGWLQFGWPNLLEECFQEEEIKWQSIQKWLKAY